MDSRHKRSEMRKAFAHQVVSWWEGQGTQVPLLFSMMTSLNGNIFRVTGHLCGEFTGPGEFPAQRPVTRSFDVFFDLYLNKQLSKQPRGWWFETPSWSLWRQCNAPFIVLTLPYGELKISNHVHISDVPRWHLPTRNKIFYTWPLFHYIAVIISAIASQITSLTIVYSTVYSGADQRKHQSSAPLALVRGIYRRPVDSPHKGPVARKMFPFDDVIMS